MKARLFFIASTLLLLFFACSKHEVRISDRVVEHSIATKEIKVLYDHVAAQLSSKMHALGYADILPDYDNTYTTGNNSGSSGGSSGSSKGGSIDVGHTFVTLEQINVDGSSIRRVVGFYPASSVNPASPSSPGAFLNDAGHNYDVSLTTIVSSQIFMNFVNSLKSTTPTYNLNSNNCTSICINNLQSAGIQLPQTIGSWPFCSGLNPADLGEDIRSMQLQPNQTRNNKTEKALENSGGC